MAEQAMETLEYSERLNVSAAEILAELSAAQRKFAAMVDEYEGAAVLQEEVDEMWQEVKHGPRVRQLEEARQVGAMAVRFLSDVCGASGDMTLHWAGLHAHFPLASAMAASAHIRLAMIRLWRETDRGGTERTARMAAEAQMVALLALRFLITFRDGA